MTTQIIDSDRRSGLRTFLAWVIEPTETGCWQWRGASGHDGYGVVNLTVEYKRRQQFKAHRVAYELLVGPIPEGLTIDHLCRNTGCVNPEHMEPVTAAENARRVHAGRTHCKNGHPLEGENLSKYKTAKSVRRVCRQCHREAQLVRYHEQKQLKGRQLKTHCLRGHELTEENVIRRGRSRHCKPCGPARYAEKKAASK